MGDPARFETFARTHHDLVYATAWRLLACEDDARDVAQATFAGVRVLGRWPGLEGGVLEGPGDLPVTTNHRDVLAPVLARHGAADTLPRVFPGHVAAPVDLYAG